MVIRSEQLKCFEKSVRDRFANELVQYCYSVSAAECEVAGNESVRQFVWIGIERAKTVGFADIDFIRLYLELMLRLGCDFDSDPQFAWAGEIIHAEPRDTEFIMASQLYRELQVYLKRVHGTRGALAHAALRRFLVSDQEWFGRTNDGQTTIMLLSSIHPEKSAYVGDDTLGCIVANAFELVRRFGLAARPGVSLIAVLTFLLGRGAISDPRYAWLPAALGDPRFKSPEDRAANLWDQSRSYVDSITTTGELFR